MDNLSKETYLTLLNNNVWGNIQTFFKQIFSHSQKFLGKLWGVLASVADGCFQAVNINTLYFCTPFDWLAPAIPTQSSSYSLIYNLAGLGLNLGAKRSTAASCVGTVW